MTRHEKRRERWWPLQYALYEPNPLMQIFYLTLVAGGYALFLVEGLPQLPNGSLGSVHIYLSGLVVLAALHSFIAASTCSPGVLLSQTIEIFDNYEYDNELYTQRKCSTCATTKIARSKHCSVCDVCVPRFDHHCTWLNTCIGERNHALFLRFIMMNTLLCAYGSYVLFFILYEAYLPLVNDTFQHETTGQTITGDFNVAIRYLIHDQAGNVVVFLLTISMGFGLLLFCCFHVYLVVHNLTTSEFFKRRAQGRISPHAYALENSLANVMELLRPRYLRRLKKKAQ